MATQFICDHHPAGDNIAGPAQDSSPVLHIPHLKKFQAVCTSLSNLSSVTLLHYTGPIKINPPCISDHIGKPYKDVYKQNESIAQAQWLSFLFSGSDTPAEWSGFMAKQARDQNDPLRPATPFVLNPLIDALPSHPDTILTTMDYFQKVMKELSLTCS